MTHLDKRREIRQSHDQGDGQGQGQCRTKHLSESQNQCNCKFKGQSKISLIENNHKQA